MVVWYYRRCYSKDILINKKRIYRLIKESVLPLTKDNKYKIKRRSSHPKSKACYPNYIWGTDTTKIKICSYGWHYPALVLSLTDILKRLKIISYSLFLQSKSSQWQDAKNQAVDHCFSKGIKDSRMKPLYLA